MARTYSVTFEQVACSGAQDLVQIKGATGKTLRILRQFVAMTDVSPPTNQQFGIRGRFLGVTVTDGSGGSTPTPKPFDPGDSAASFTALANSTSKASSSGTVNILEENGCNSFAGYDYMFPVPPIIGPGESYVFELLSAPTGTPHLSGGVIVQEQGG